jgi:hypothetical protein
MSDTVKLTQEELDELKAIQSIYQEKTYSFGQLYIDKLNLSEKLKEIDSIEATLKQDLIEAQKKEQNWMDKISSKYGDGNLSLKDGTFTPVKK